MEIGPGIGVAGSRCGSFNWDAYWISLISATVENAARDKIVLTFPSAKPSLIASDFSVTGKTISTAIWTGNVLTITVTVAFDWGDSPVVTFVKTGQTVNVTNNISYPAVIEDGNTVGWFDYKDLATITKDGANRMSVWADKLGSGHDLLQANGANQPLLTADGVLFDGISDFMKCLPFAYIQPEMIYFVGKQITWTVNDYFLDGENVASVIIFQSATTPKLKAYSGVFSAENSNLVLNTWGIIRVLYNGISSKLIINNTAPIEGDFGNTKNSNGFTLGSDGVGNHCSNIEVKEIILRKTADAAAVQTAIYNYLQTINEL